MTKDEKIKKYHIEEITYILLVLASDLSSCDENYLTGVAEDIEGRIDVLFTYDYLITLKGFIENNDVINKLEKLKECVLKLYTSEWHHKFKAVSNEIKVIRALAIEILDHLHIEYIEPVKYSENI